jgi:DNA-binding response OmpR family regulator
MIKRILLIDDEKDFCSFTKNNLEATGNFVVTICFDSSDAVDLAKRLSPDLILLDVLMPGISGPDIAAALREDIATKNIPVVFLTAIITDRETKGGNVISGWPFVPKPVKINELIAVINKHIK